MRLRGVRAAVTGAGGFIGLHLCARLRAEGAEVRGLELDAARRAAVQAAGAEHVPCDVTDPAALRAALQGCALVAHAAARVTEWGPAEEFVRLNVRGTAAVIDAAAACGAERVLHLSSVAAFGYEHRSELGEDAAPRPCGIPYIDTKGASDRLALERARRGAPVVVVRPGDVYGPGSVPWIVRPLRLIRARRFAVPCGPGTVMVPVYVDDLVEACLLALTSGRAAGRAYTVWDGHPVSARQFFAYHARMLGRRGVPCLPRPALLALGALTEAAARLRGSTPEATRASVTFLSRRAPYSTRRAREELGWEPRVTLDEGMRRCEAWAREQGLL